MKKRALVKYPLKIGYSDKSGVEENVITDANDRAVVGDWGDCCKSGGIQERSVALVIVRTLNRERPRFMVAYYGDK